MGDLEAEHDYLMEVEASLHSISSMQQEWQEKCKLRPDPGPCRGRLPRYYFLPRTGKCLEFPWGGCGGNANNFVSTSQCQATCSRPTTAQANPVSAAMQEHPHHIKERDSAACHMEPDAGPCDQRLTRWYFSQGKCQRFQYGGCAGNRNNFGSIGACWRVCGAGGAVPLLGRGGECQLPLEQGEDCGQQETERWWWDLRLRSCQPFLWTGCGGNANNFQSRKLCSKKCGTN